MMRSKVAYIPDEIWYSGKVDHYEFFDKEHYAIATYKDGHTERIDTTVTPDMEAVEREKEWERYKRIPGVTVLGEFHLLVQASKFISQIVNFKS